MATPGIGSSTTLAQQIRAFNAQQFASNNPSSSSRAGVSPVDALLASDSDADPQDDDDDAAAAFGDDDDADEKAALAMMSTLQLLQARGRRPLAQRPSQRTKKAPVAHAELAHAEERVAALEAQLLDAEETICHLTAEKRAALRSVEKLTRALQAAPTTRVNIWRMTSSSSAEDDDERDDGARPETLSDDDGGDNNNSDGDHQAESDSVDALRVTVRKLQEQLKSRELAQEERAAVIREQEREIQKLKLELERVSETCEDLDARLFRAFDDASPASLAAAARRRRASTAEDATGAYDAAGALLLRNQSVSSLHDQRRRRSLSLESASSGGACSESSESSESVDTAPTSSESVECAGDQWREELVRHPTPHFDLDSPEVQYLLHAWTTNLPKLQYLRVWFAQVAAPRGPLPPDLPRGVELPRLLPEIRDGFLALVVPLLRKQALRDIQVHSRQYNDQFHADLRIRVIPRT